MEIFSRISQLFKSGIAFVYYNIRYIRRSFAIKEGKYALVNFDRHLKNDEHSLYFYMTCMYLTHAGFNLIIKSNWHDFSTFKKPLDFKRYLLKQKHIFVRRCSAPLNTIVLVQPNTTDHTIYLSYGFHLASKFNNMIKSGQIDCSAPYPMFPFQYELYSDPAFAEYLKKTKRTIKIFFAGSTNKIKYANKKIQTFFNVIPRLEVIKFILSAFEKSRKLENDSDKLTLLQLLESKDYINEIIISTVKTAKEDWLKTLSKTDFFICPPGVRIPLCHNCVEAMSVGAIPILEYADLFSPHLEDLKNCLSYTNYAELQLTIEKALAMEQSEIENMRKNVFDYYNNYLSFDSITKKIIKFSNSAQQKLKVAIPFVATKEEWEIYANECRHLFNYSK